MVALLNYPDMLMVKMLTAHPAPHTPRRMPHAARRTPHTFYCHFPKSCYAFFS
jgi:hypothetical protein